MGTNDNFFHSLKYFNNLNHTINSVIYLDIGHRMYVHT